MWSVRSALPRPALMYGGGATGSYISVRRSRGSDETRRMGKSGILPHSTICTAVHARGERESRDPLLAALAH